MSALTTAVRREFRVAFSRRAQPAWFRVVKWTVALAFITRYHGASWFWPFVAAWGAAALVLHFFYRWQTRAWSRPWGGWNDVQTANGIH